MDCRPSGVNQWCFRICISMDHEWGWMVLSGDRCILNSQPMVHADGGIEKEVAPLSGWGGINRGRSIFGKIKLG